jgi:hypothetical protein
LFDDLLSKIILNAGNLPLLHSFLKNYATIRLQLYFFLLFLNSLRINLILLSYLALLSRQFIIFRLFMRGYYHLFWFSQLILNLNLID